MFQADKVRLPWRVLFQSQNVFDKLEEQCINVSPEDRLFKWFIVYDFESMHVPVNEPNSEKLTWTHDHVPISVSVCSNVEGYRQPHCIIQPDIEFLVKDMVKYMTEIASKIYMLAKEKFVEAFDRLDAVIDGKSAETNDLLL